MNLPVFEFVNQFFDIDNFHPILTNNKVQDGYSRKIFFDKNELKEALDFYLDFQHSFSCVIQADKADAAKFDNFIDKQKSEVGTFSGIFLNQLNTYLAKLKQNSELNKLRTSIREHAVRNIKEGLKNEEYIFELTAPTGSGKTFMMPSLASEIIRTKGAKRIIYGLPFLSITEQVESEVLKIFEGEGTVCSTYPIQNQKINASKPLQEGNRFQTLLRQNYS